jgi:nitroreductase
MNADFLTLSRIIRERRAVFPQFYKPGKISKELILNILENGIWAPTHKKHSLGGLSSFKMKN